MTTRKKRAAVSPKQKRFVEEYLIDLNGTKAVVRAGYSANGADVQASRLLKNGEVRKAIDKAIDARSKRTEITQDLVLRELYWILVSDIDNYDAAGNLKPGVPKGATKALAGIKRKILQTGEGVKLLSAEIRLWDKPRAILIAMRQLGLLNDKLTLNLDEEMRKLIGNAATDYDRRISELAARAKKNAAS